MSPTGRLLALLSLLQARRDWPADTLSGRLEVSARTVRRDVDRLREMGYRIRAVKGPHGGYRLDAGSELPPLLFDDEQAIAVAIALQTAPASGAGIADAAMRALSTVRQVMPSRLRHRMDALEVTALPAPDTGADAATLVALAAAVHACEVVRFDYGDDADRPARRAEPHHVVAHAGRWYLVAWSLDDEDWRIYRVDRIRLRVPNGPRFAPRTVPGGDVAAFVEGRFRGVGPGADWACRGSAVVALPARRVRPFVGEGIVEAIDDARCRVSLGSWSWAGLAASLARFDAELTEVQPARLREAFVRLSARFAEAGAYATE